MSDIREIIFEHDSLVKVSVETPVGGWRETTEEKKFIMRIVDETVDKLRVLCSMETLEVCKTEEDCEEEARRLIAMIFHDELPSCAIDSCVRF